MLYTLLYATSTRECQVGKVGSYEKGGRAVKLIEITRQSRACE